MTQFGLLFTLGLQKIKINTLTACEEETGEFNREFNSQTKLNNKIKIESSSRISALSADEQTFHESAPIYQNALRHSNFDHKTRLHEASTTKNTQKQTTQYHLV